MVVPEIEVVYEELLFQWIINSNFDTPIKEPHDAGLQLFIPVIVLNRTNTLQVFWTSKQFLPNR